MKVTKHGNRYNIIWNIDDESDVQEAEEFFHKLTRQGWLAATKEEELRRVLDFNPIYRELWFIPLVEGG
jgi:hypothetical protein